MNPVNRWLRQSNKLRLALALLPLAAIGTVLTATASSAQADQVRVCENYGVVRDRSDHEAPLLPRRSIAHCARSYQTLYQTHRVRPASPHSRVSDSNPSPNATNAPVENPTSTTPVTNTPLTDTPGSSADTYTR